MRHVVRNEVPPYTRIVRARKPLRTCIFLALCMFSVHALLPASAANATGHFEVYCDGVGIFLARIDGAPGPGKLVLFSSMSLPPGTMGGRYFGQGKWCDVAVYRDGCLPDGKCESIAHGKVWIDAWDAPSTQARPPNTFLASTKSI